VREMCVYASILWQGVFSFVRVHHPEKGCESNWKVPPLRVPFGF